MSAKLSIHGAPQGPTQTEPRWRRGRYAHTQKAPAPKTPDRSGEHANTATRLGGCGRPQTSGALADQKGKRASSGEEREGPCGTTKGSGCWPGRFSQHPPPWSVGHHSLLCSRSYREHESHGAQPTNQKCRRGALGHAERGWLTLSPCPAGPTQRSVGWVAKSPNTQSISTGRVVRAAHGPRPNRFRPRRDDTEMASDSLTQVPIKG